MADDAQQPGGERKRAWRSLRFQLLFWTHVSVIGVLVVFMAWDYAHARRQWFEEKRVAMTEEANTLLPAVRRLAKDPAAVQAFIDEVCGKMQDASSPGHHIAVKTAKWVLQAHAHHRASAAMLRAMSAGAASSGGAGRIGDQLLIVGHASRGDTSVYVSEYVSNMMHVMRARLVSRMLSILIVGAILAVVVNVLIGYLVTRPLHAVVAGVRRLKTGELGVQVAAVRTADFGFLAGEFNAMSAALARAEAERRRHMKKARRIQGHLMPRIDPDAGIRIGFVYEPATDVGGDYVDVKAVSSAVTLLCIADVTGHGVPAAMGAAMLKTLFETSTHESGDPVEILDRINRGFLSVSLDEDFATMVVAAVDRAGRRLTWASAGHEFGYLLRGGGDVEVLPSTGIALGISLELPWESITRGVSAGDRLVLITDGVTEALGTSGERFGQDRLKAALTADAPPSAEALARHVADAVAAFRGLMVQQDDVTILVADL